MRIQDAFSLCLSLALLLALASCTSTYEQRELTAPSAVLDTTRKVVVALPADGRYSTTVYADSGRTTAQAVVDAFASHAASATTLDASAGHSAESALSAARGANAGYLALPEILHWEDRATEWSGREDVLAVRLSVYEVPSGSLLASAEIHGKSKWMTFGGDHPQDLLADPIQHYVAGIYGR